MAKSGADIYQPNIHRYPGSQLHTTATCLPASPCAHILSTTAISHLQPLPTEPFWHKFHTTNTATTGFSDGTTQFQPQLQQQLFHQGPPNPLHWTIEEDTSLQEKIPLGQWHLKTATKFKSRRISQQRRKCYLKSSSPKKEYNIKIKQALHFTKLRCLQNFGFFASPTKALQQNFNIAVASNPSPLHCQPKNLAFHNLCKTEKLPIGIKNLLGLNLKFCLGSNNPQNNINKTVLRKARSIRTNYYLKQHNLDSNKDYEKQIYVRNTSCPLARWRQNLFFWKNIKRATQSTSIEKQKT